MTLLFFLGLFIGCLGQLSNEESQILQEIATCLITKNVDFTKFEKSITTLYDKSVISVNDLPDSISSEWFSQLPEVQSMIRTDIGKKAIQSDLMAKMLFGDPNFAILNSKAVVTAARVADINGKILPSPWTSSEMQVAKNMKQFQYKLEQQIAQHQIRKQTEILRDKLKANLINKISTGQGLTPKQHDFMRKMRFKAIGKQIGVNAGLTTGVSLILNVKTLFAGEVTRYFVDVGKDTGISVACQVLGLGLEEVGLDTLAPGASVIVLGVIDLIKASRTGDWSRFGLNIGLNAGATVGSIALGKAGASIGTAILPGWGTLIGGIIGGIAGGVGVRYGLGYTRLGKMTQLENDEAVKKIAEKMNPTFNEAGFEIDTSVEFEELIERWKKGDLPLRPTKDYVEIQNRGFVTLDDIDNILGGSTHDFLSLSSMVGQSRIEGLKIIKLALGC